MELEYEYHTKLCGHTDDRLKRLAGQGLFNKAPAFLGIIQEKTGLQNLFRGSMNLIPSEGQKCFQLSEIEPDYVLSADEVFSAGWNSNPMSLKRCKVQSVDGVLFYRPGGLTERLEVIAPKIDDLSCGKLLHITI